MPFLYTETSPHDVISVLLLKSALKYPNKRFVLLVDAVNQLDVSMEAWTMWWLPTDKCPNNVRFIFTTLDDANGTFQNALQVCEDFVVSVDIHSFS